MLYLKTPLSTLRHAAISYSLLGVDGDDGDDDAGCMWCVFTECFSEDRSDVLRRKTAGSNPEVRYQTIL